MTLNIDKFMADLRERKDNDLFYEYPDENLKTIEQALKLQRLVEAEIDRIIHLNPHRISWYTRQQLLEKLLEESRGKQ